MIFWLVLLGLQRAPVTHTVEIRGMAFHPAELTAQVGDTVVWINRDIVPHTATAAGASSWDTGQLTQGQAGRVIVRRRGTARYVCTLHPMMRATLKVR